MKYRRKVFAIECKASLSPQLKKGFYLAVEDIQPVFSFVAAPVREGWSSEPLIRIVSLEELIDSIQLMDV